MSKRMTVAQAGRLGGSKKKGFSPEYIEALKVRLALAREKRLANLAGKV